MRAVWLIAVVTALTMAGCFNPKYENGSLHCAAGPHPCPDGYYCAVTGTCWLRDTGPPRPPLHLTTASSGNVRVTAPGAHGAKVSIGQPLVGTPSAAGQHGIELGLLPNSR